MKSIISQMKYIEQLWIRKTFSSRSYSLLILYFFINYLYCKPVSALSISLQHKTTPWVFPFMLSTYQYTALFLVGVIYYFSDVPFIQHHNMYQIIRTGRKKWALGQISVIVFQSFFLIIVNMVMTFILLFRNLEFSTAWGKLLHTVSLTNAGEITKFIFGVSNEAMSRFEPIELMILTLIMGGLVISFMGLLMFAISLFANRVIAVATGAVMVLMIYFVENAHPLLKAPLARFVPASWIRVANIDHTIYGSSILPSMEYMLAVLIVGIVLLSIVVMFRIRYVELHWNKED